MDVKVAISVDPKEESIKRTEKKIENNLKPTIDLKFKIPQNALKQVGSQIAEIQNRIQRAFESASTITQKQSLIQGVGGTIPGIETQRNISLKESIEEQLQLRRYEAEEEVRIKREALEQKQKLEDLFARTQTSIDVGKTKLLEAEKTVTNEKLEELTGTAQRLSNSFDGLTESAQKAYDQFERDKDINAYTQTMESLTDKTKKLRQEQLSLNRETQNSKSQFKDLGKTLLNNMKQFAAWTSATSIVMAVVKVVKQMIKTVMELDKAFTNIRMVTGYTNEQIQELKENYAELAQQLKVTTKEVAEAANEWLRQGLSVEDTTTALTAAIKFAKVATISTTEATELLTSAMKGYGLTVESLITISDRLNKVDMASATSAADLAKAMSETAASAKSAGIQMNTLIGYLATMSEVTQDSAETIGNSMKTILARMTQVAAGVDIDEYGESLNNVDKVLNQYGISLADSTGKMRNMEVVLDEVAAKWKILSNTQRNQIATAIAGKQALCLNI